MSLNRWAAKRDANERAIIDALEAVGAKVWQISGRGKPDLLVRYKGRYEAGEVKTRTGKLRKTQGDFDVWRTAEDALAAIGIR